jgi:hypothetical protein
MFRCYLFSMVYVKKFVLNLCDFVLCFLGLNFCIVTGESYFDLELSGLIQNIFTFCCTYVHNNESF